MPADIGRSILIVGASRGLGHAMAAEFAERGWGVLGTVRAAGTPLHRLAAERPCSVEIETLGARRQGSPSTRTSRLVVERWRRANKFWACGSVRNA